MKTFFKMRFYSQFSLLILFFCLSKNLIAQCNANFNFTLGANGSATISSTSTGTSANTTYSWTSTNSNFGSTAASLSYTFTDNQIYTVSLLITDPNSVPTCTSSITKTIGISSAPCGFTWYTTISSGLNGQMSYSCLPWGGGSLVGTGYTFSWDFGDGGTSNLCYASHTYTLSGVYAITFTATSYSSICTQTSSITVTITVSPPCNLSAGYTYTLGANGLVHFKSTTTGTTSGTLYNWEFNDNSIGVNSYLHDTISRRFPSNITYPVSHSAYYTSPNWCADTIVQTISITNATVCSAISSYTIEKDTTQNLTWHIWASYPPNISNVTWDWGDSTTSTGLYPSHSYNTSGWYNICANASVSCGSTYSMCLGQFVYKSNGIEGATDMIAIQVSEKPIQTEHGVGLKQSNLEKINVKIWPNPNKGIFELKMEGIEVNTVFNLKISNLLGQSVYKETLQTESSSLSKTISLEDLPNGTYFLHLKSERSYYATKIIIAR